ncbi:MAG: FtsX-like permease family protein [Cytophagales bacterium]|nr:FtsX-like permease family protein [Cytophagales bacterium]
MLKNYFLTILRQVRKNQTFSLINIFGLAMGMAACIVIAQFVYFHLQFDKHYADSDRIVKIERVVSRNGQDLGVSAYTSPMTIEQTMLDLPEVESRVRFRSIDYQNNSITYKGNGDVLTFEQPELYAADKEAFDLFQIEFLAGNAEKFDQPNKIVLNESSARKYFSDFEGAIGAKIDISGNVGSFSYEVVGIMKDLPANTHFDFNVLFSFPTLESYGLQPESWTSGNVHSYLKLQSLEDQEVVLSHINSLFETHAKERLQQYGYDITFQVIPIEEIHLFSEASSDFKESMDYRLIIALATIAFIILFIAWINYLNLSLVKTIDRLKEVGIRKVLGSRTRQITALFTTEAVFLNLISFIVALTLAQLTSPFTSQLTGVKFSFFQNMEVTLLLFVLVIVGSVIIGLYPAIMLRTFNMTNILVGNKRKQKVGGFGLRSILVAIQFTVTFLLIAATITVYKQVSFMKSADLGININDIMVLKSPPGDINSNDRQDVVSYNAFKTALTQQTGIASITNAGEIPGEPISWGTGIRLKNADTEDSQQVSLVSMGKEFLDFFELEVVAGRQIREGDDPWTKGDVWINEKMTEILGFEKPEDAVGVELEGFYAPLQVRGIVENHHHNSLHFDYDPIAYILSSWTEFYFVKFDIANAMSDDQRVSEFNRLVNIVESEWAEVFTNNQIDYFFLDQSFNRQYASDERFGRIFGTFSLLAILIACLGLFGLTSFTLQQRTKEIGIRKVLGAELTHLILLLSKSYFIVIGIAYAIAMPAAWYFLSDWLQQYHFQIDLGSWLFWVPLTVVVVIAMVTILSRMLKFIKLNPVNSLRYE